MFQYLFGGDPGILQTVARMKDGVNYALREPNQAIRKRAESIIRRTDIPERDEASEIQSIAQFVRDRFHYVNDPSGLEYIKSPEIIDHEIDSYQTFMGDCDDASTYLAALLKSVGYHVNFTVVTPQKSKTGAFTHVYVQVYSPKLKRWVSLDMTAKQKTLGWNPASQRYRSYEV